ncbi:MAG: hypothetical protein KGZ39_07055, partial [Simkania sp.]|nr:hypothetical protein [Simkania sp.]
MPTIHKVTKSTSSASRPPEQPPVKALHPIDKKIDSLRKQLQQEIASATTSEVRSKTDKELVQIKEEIKARFVELKGNHYKDPTSLLDQASKKAKKDPSHRQHFEDLQAEATHLAKELEE